MLLLSFLSLFCGDLEEPSDKHIADLDKAGFSKEQIGDIAGVTAEDIRQHLAKITQPMVDFKLAAAADPDTASACARQFLVDRIKIRREKEISIRSELRTMRQEIIQKEQEVLTLKNVYEARLIKFLEKNQ